MKLIKWLITFPWNDGFKTQYFTLHALSWAIIVSIPMFYFLLK